ncbi:MAG: DDE-type integrase/transposase/recombinase [Flavobacteriales bacterium]|nr:DDE-type integrase/transposase/recombinase [Flavobacteriales bacterium]
MLADHGLLVRRLRKYIHTTRSSHWLRKWPNLIKDRKLTGPGQLWVSDITYFKTGKEGYTYISLITDAWSHRIMGHHLATDLEAASTLEALRMAIAQAVTVPKGLIHHSDRGVQYCSQAYVDVLQANGIGISMTEKGDPWRTPWPNASTGSSNRNTSIHGASIRLHKRVPLWNVPCSSTTPIGRTTASAISHLTKRTPVP